MYITKKTRTREIIHFIDESNIEEIISKIPPYPLKKSVMELTIDEFNTVSSEDYIKQILKEKYAYKALGKLRTLREQMKLVEKLSSINTIEQSAEEKQAANGIQFVSGIERMLIDVTEFFHLHSFAEAEKRTVGEWIVINMHKTSQAKYERNYNKMQEAKQKQRKK